MPEFMGPMLHLGYQFKVRLAATASVFPEGCVLVAQVRDKVSSTTILTTLSTANGGIVRVSDTEIDLVIDGETTREWTAPVVTLDIVRTDVEPDQYLGIRLTIRTDQPVTRDL